MCKCDFFPGCRRASLCLLGILTLSLPESNLESINVVVPFESVDKTLVCDHSNESYWAVLSCGAVCFWQFCKIKFKIFFSILNLALLGVKWLRKKVSDEHCYGFDLFLDWFTSFTENKTSSGQSPDSTVKPPSSSLLSGHCSRIGKLCQNMGYNFTQMPNYFNQQSQNDATHELSQFTRMIQSKCSSVLHVFLCSLYFPPCLDDAESATPPCRSVCRAARRGCESSRFKWPYKFKCSGFPERSDQACVGEDGSITHGKN